MYVSYKQNICHYLISCMGIYYEKQCYSDTGVTAVAEAGGYPELGPAMELAQAALDRSDEAVIGHHCHVTLCTGLSLVTTVT